jgi:excisionase family DNA binding protein
MAKTTLSETNMKEQNIGRLAYSVKEVAASLGVSSRTIHNFIRKGKLGHFRLGTRVLVEADSLRRFIESRTDSRQSVQMPENLCTGLKGGDNG